MHVLITDRTAQAVVVVPITLGIGWLFFTALRNHRRDR